MLSSDGTLSPAEFVAASRAFIAKWNSVSHDLPPWSWTSCKSSPFASSYQDFISGELQVDGYLSLERMALFKRVEVDGRFSDDELGDSCGLSDEDPVDNATLVGQPGYEVHYCDFHIVYSSSYRVPVMYFRGYNSGGQQLMLDEIEKDLPASSAKILTESKWTFITQMEHPYLNRPWFTLHPCGTNELMRLIYKGDDSRAKRAVSIDEYLSSWLSVVGQVVGIRVPLEMGITGSK